MVLGFLFWGPDGLSLTLLAAARPRLAPAWCVLLGDDKTWKPPPAAGERRAQKTQRGQNNEFEIPPASLPAMMKQGRAKVIIDETVSI